MLLPAFALIPTLLAAQIAVTVDPTPGDPISPLIYGMNLPSSQQQSEAHLTLARWGGTATTRYNYKTDTHNTASDYFFENVPGCLGVPPNFCNPVPTDPQEQSTANRFLQDTQAAGMSALFTIPIMGKLPKGPAAYTRPFPCSCPAGLGADPQQTTCRDGQAMGGGTVACTNATSIHLDTDAIWTTEWVTYLVGKFGPSNGKRIYALDNEPGLWSSAHHDVRTNPLTYDEQWQRMRDHAVAILDADPTALIAGPAEWGWTGYFCSDIDGIACTAASPDRAAHGGLELVAWLLEQAKAHEEAHGRRILHYLDLHYYAQGGNNPERTRSLWDATYVDPSWIDSTIRLLPRMHDWVDQHYPGTKLALSEYSFFDHGTATSAQAYAEALGIFGRYKVDLAATWGGPAPDERAFAAFKLYRNYDGNGSAFEDHAASATVAGSGVQAYAASSASRVTVVLVNELAAAQDVNVSVGGFPSADTARWFVNSTGTTITAQPDVTVAGGHAVVALPAGAIAMLVFTSNAAGTSSSSASPPASSASSNLAPATSGSSLAATSGVPSSSAWSMGDSSRPATSAPATSAAGSGTSAGTSSTDAAPGDGTAARRGCGCLQGHDSAPWLVLALSGMALWRRRRR